MRICAALLLSLLCAVFAFPASAATTAGKNDKDLGAFGAWRTYAYEEGGQNVCYMVTTKVIGAKTKTSKPRITYLMITHRPVEASIDTFSYGAGVELDSKHGASLVVGKDTFDLFSVRDTAWARDSITDHKLAKAILASSSAQVLAVRSRGMLGTVRDRFDLKGAASAYRAINKACGLAGVDVKEPTQASPPKKAAVKSGSKGSKAATAKFKISKAGKSTPPKKAKKPSLQSTIDKILSAPPPSLTKTRKSQ